MLSFHDLRLANRARQPEFRNAKGGLSHSAEKPRALSWWGNAICGELGEAANVVKKIERGDFTLEEARPHLAHELADVVTYVDLLAHNAGIDLGAAVVEKFNIVSERVGASTRLAKRSMVYLACPHSHPDPEVREARYLAVCREAARLFALGHWVYSPISHTHEIAKHMDNAMTFDAWREYDRHMLSLCDKLMVLQLEGWAKSKGVLAELDMAAEFGIAVEFIPAQQASKEAPSETAPEVTRG